MLIALDPLLANICGFAGMACIIFAYAYATQAREPNPFVQHGVNLAGAALLTVSLLVHLNPASPSSRLSNTGKEVAIGRVSSTSMPFVLARPATASDMAMR